MKSISIARTLILLLVAALAVATRAAEPDSVAPGTLAYHLATNAAARFTPPVDFMPFRAANSLGLDRITTAHWSHTFWLHDVVGLSATPIGFTNLPSSGQGLPTMVSPRHYLCATHMHPEGYLIAFLDTNDVVHYRRTLQRVEVGNDTSVGILNEDLPPAVGFLPVLPANFTNYLPATPTNFIQGIGMNQDFYLFGQPMLLANGWGSITWNPNETVPNGLPKTANIAIRGGDSSSPEMLLIGNQLVLATHIYFARGGPSYPQQIPLINEKMHFLSTNNHVGSDYQLTEFSLTNWPKIH